MANEFTDDMSDFEESNSFSPNIDSNTFKQRNDPEELLLRYKLQLMNAYKTIVETKDLDTGEIKKTIKIKQKKNTKPKANKQGIEDIISYVEKYINSHTVQGNMINMDEFRAFMKATALDITKHFLENRDNWNITVTDTDVLISTTVNLIHVFISRAIENEERKGYGESYKETTSREVKDQEKPNLFQKMGSFLGKSR